MEEKQSMEEKHSKKMIKNIIFDIGNVLADFRWKEFLEEKVNNQAMAERIAKATVLSKYWKEVDRGKWPEEKIIAAFIENDPEIGEEIKSVFADYRGLVSPREYAIPWIRELRNKGYGTYYLSNFSERAGTDCGDALAFMPYMNGGILSCREQIVKPEPAIYRLLLSRFGLEAQECVFLDDTKENVEAAQAEGMYGIWFRNQEQAQKEMEALGVK